MGKIAVAKQYGIPKAPNFKKEARREKDKGYLAWLHELPCCVSGAYGVIAHHIEIESYRMGVKTDDKLALPLREELHNIHPGSLHMIGEANFWNQHGIDPFNLAFSLYKVYTDYHGNIDFAQAIIKAHRDLGRWCKTNGIEHFDGKVRRK